MISDLSHGNYGAYWEAGFAEGLGKAVIYTCERTIFETRIRSRTSTRTIALPSSGADDKPREAAEKQRPRFARRSPVKRNCLTTKASEMTPMRGMRIPFLGRLIVDSWVTAEERLREKVNDVYRDRDEEIITDLFRGEFVLEFDKVSHDGSVARAFLSDLKLAFPTIIADGLSRVARGLIATVSFHPRQTEQRSGNDRHRRRPPRRTNGAAGWP